MATECWLQH